MAGTVRSSVWGLKKKNCAGSGVMQRERDTVRDTELDGGRRRTVR